MCTPLSAAGRAYGVICADRGGGRFELSDGERHLLWTLGKTAALVATARNATRQQERNHRLGERLELAREIHERVMQRLFGVSLALSAERSFDDEERERCRVEMQEALSDLRRALERPLAAMPRDRDDAGGRARTRQRCARPRLEVLAPGTSVPAEIELLAQSVLAEALRNVAKHVLRPPDPGPGGGRRGHLHARGPQRRRRGRGPRGRHGAALAAFEALQHGGVVEFGAPEAGCWRVRLVVLAAATEAE